MPHLWYYGNDARIDKSCPVEPRRSDMMHFISKTRADQGTAPQRAMGGITRPLCEDASPDLADRGGLFLGYDKKRWGQ